MNNKKAETYKTLFVMGGLKCSCGNLLKVHYVWEIPIEDNFLLLAATEKRVKNSFVIFNIKKNKVIIPGTFDLNSGPYIYNHIASKNEALLSKKIWSKKNVEFIKTLIENGKKIDIEDSFFNEVCY